MGAEKPSHTRDSSDPFRHHLFVSYGPSSRDRDWVKNKLIRKTDRQTSEEGRRRRDEAEPNAINNFEEPAEEIEATGDLEVFFEDRDLLPNQSEITTLGEAIYNSKRVVLVISEDYLNDGRRWAEIDLALQSRTELHLQLHESIILVLLDPDVDVKLPATLRSIVSRDEQLEWPENDRAGQNLFWGRLEDRIRRELFLKTILFRFQGSHVIWRNFTEYNREFAETWFLVT